MVLAEGGGFAQAQSLLQRAAELAGVDERQQGLVQVAFCRLHKITGDLDEARAHGQRASAILESHGGPDDAAEAAIYLASVEGEGADYGRAEKLYNRALKLLQGSSNRRLTTLAHWGLGSTLYYLERYLEAAEHLTIAAQCGRDLLTLRERGTMQMSLAVVHRERGELEEALNTCTETVQVLEQAGQPDMVADLHNAMGSIYLRLGDRARARAQYKLAQDVLGDLAVPQAAETHYEMARLEMEEGNPQEGLRLAHRALEIAHDLKSDMEEGRASLTLGQALISLGRFAEAVPHLRRAQAVFTERGLEQSKVVAGEILQYAERRQQGCATSTPY